MRAVSDKRLHLSSAIETRQLRDGTRLLKQLAREEYLALNPDHWAIIGRFNGDRTVEQVLHSLLADGAHPGIRPFYDLVLNAWNKGFLVEAEEGLSAGTLATEPVDRLSPRLAGSMGLSLGLITAGTFAFLQTPIAFLYQPGDWLQLALFVSLGVSLSYVLSGSVLTGFGRKVSRMRFRWDRGLPFLHVDTRDAFMGGRFCEIAVALRGLSAPFALALVCVLVESVNGLLGCGLTMLIIGCPFGGTAAHSLLHALFRKEYELPRCAERFLNAKLIPQIFNWQAKLEEERYLMTYSAYAIMWLGVVFHYANEIFGMLLWQSVTGQLAEMSQAILSLNVAVVAVLIAGIGVFGIWVLGRAAWRLLAPRLFPAEGAITRQAGAGQRPPEDLLEHFLAKNLLFSQLEPKLRKSVMSALKYVVVKPGTTLIRERDHGDSVFVLYDGEVEVLKEDETGRERRVATLGPGDAFGEVALLESGVRTSTVRSVGPAGLFVLGKEDFDRLLVSELGAQQVRETIQVCAFLRRHSLFSDWHPQALMTLAHQFAFVDCPPGTKVLKQGVVNDAFYLIYEGEFQVHKDGQKLSQLGPGDFVGEISLLRETAATADVVAEHQGRCLRLGKADFMRFVSHDFLTGMAIETALESRLVGRAA